MPDPEVDGDPLDQAYHTLGGLQAWAQQHKDAQAEDLKEIEKLQEQLIAQREAAAAAGERDSYDRLSAELALLAKAYQAASEDPDADPLEQYRPDDSEPGEQDIDQPQENTDGNDDGAGPRP